MKNESSHLENTAKVIGALLDEIFTGLSDIARQLVDTVDTASDAHPSRRSLGHLDASLGQLVNDHAGLVDGAGIAFGQNVLSDAEYWLEWWRGDGAGGPLFAPHDFDPSSVHYYDYSAMPWFEVPSRSGQAAVVGPFIDSGGTNLNILTLGVPAQDRLGRRSVIGADIRVQPLESIFLETLNTKAGRVLMVNDLGRVIASNTASYVTGTRLDVPAADMGLLFEEDIAVPCSHTSRLQWHIGTLREGTK
ncbi:hypothetical protein GCM10009596_15130 [Arthrobacter rhombi]|uniref:cache domain-containing protein n=1 Tax=Arthrobacter rhombi TaxID=71253 RepID=UPI0031D52E8C